MLKHIKRRFFIFIIISAVNFNVPAYAESMNKEQILFSPDKNEVTYIDKSSHINDKIFENSEFFKDINGSVYISTNVLKYIFKDMQYGKCEENAGIIKLTDIYSNNELSINVNTIKAEIYDYSNKKIYTLNIVKKNDKIFIPLRALFNSFDYSDNQIIYNNTLKTISVNRKPCFETASVGVSVNIADFYSGLYSEEYTVKDDENIDKLVSVLNKEPFYNSNSKLRCENPKYELNFNNGTVLKVWTESLCDVYVDGNLSGRYILPYNASVEIERFISSSCSGKISPESWWFDLSNEDDLYKKEFIVCDCNADDYSYLINYLRSQIKDFDSKFTMEIKRDNGVILNFKSAEGDFSVCVYEDYGAVRSYVDVAISFYK